MPSGHEREVHAAGACTRPFRAGRAIRDLSACCCWVRPDTRQLTDRITLSDREVLAERAEPPFLTAPDSEFFAVVTAHSEQSVAQRSPSPGRIKELQPDLQVSGILSRLTLLAGRSSAFPGESSCRYRQ
jgi:hypothetical protein